MDEKESSNEDIVAVKSPKEFVPSAFKLKLLSLGSLKAENAIDLNNPKF